MKQETQADYIRRRLHETGWTQKILAEYLDVKPSTISSLLSERLPSISSENLTKAAIFFGDDPLEILRNTGRAAAAEVYYKIASEISRWKVGEEPGANALSEIPIVGCASAGSAELNLDYTDQGFPPGIADEFIAIVAAPENAYGIKIEGNSLSPIFPNGTKIITAPLAPFIPDRTYVIRATDGRCWIKTVKLREETYSLISINPDYPRIFLDLKDTKWLHAVKWVKMP